MSLDFLDILNNKINELNLYARSTIGLLGEEDSISIMAMPGGAEVVYYSGVRDKDYQIQVNAKSQNQLNCFNALTTIYQTLERLNELPSSNGSYSFDSINITSLPSLVNQNEQGYYEFALSISAKITIYKE
ncbi:minor capsid protein [Alkalihalobacillus trypoxylicola]|uniref:Minor capsid protein n=1 Tax=Alkalihalobacillus trypoxylicola TaxID=519424 RepID=A0A162D5G1_9BACI|nr:minor capsid protein [Alkalihalobacillus trypoxylicola]KYG28177.1 hypothetical protein AZF04_09755 [Alkalihalobacillus trypoxylicola]